MEGLFPFLYRSRLRDSVCTISSLDFVAAFSSPFASFFWGFSPFSLLAYVCVVCVACVLCEGGLHRLTSLWLSDVSRVFLLFVYLLSASLLRTIDFVLFLLLLRCARLARFKKSVKQRRLYLLPSLFGLLWLPSVEVVAVFFFVCPLRKLNKNARWRWRCRICSLQQCVVACVKIKIPLTAFFSRSSLVQSEVISKGVRCASVAAPADVFRKEICFFSIMKGTASAFWEKLRLLFKFFLVPFYFRCLN